MPRPWTKRSSSVPGRAAEVFPRDVSLLGQPLGGWGWRNPDMHCYDDMHAIFIYTVIHTYASCACFCRHIMYRKISKIHVSMQYIYVILGHMLSISFQLTRDEDWTDLTMTWVSLSKTRRRLTVRHGDGHPLLHCCMPTTWLGTHSENLIITVFFHLISSGNMWKTQLLISASTHKSSIVLFFGRWLTLWSDSTIPAPNYIIERKMNHWHADGSPGPPPLF